MVNRNDGYVQVGYVTDKYLKENPFGKEEMEKDQKAGYFYERFGEGYMILNKPVGRKEVK